MQRWDEELRAGTKEAWVWADQQPAAADGATEEDPPHAKCGRGADPNARAKEYLTAVWQVDYTLDAFRRAVGAGTSLLTEAGDVATAVRSFRGAMRADDISQPTAGVQSAELDGKLTKKCFKDRSPPD